MDGKCGMSVKNIHEGFPTYYGCPQKKYKQFTCFEH